MSFEHQDIKSGSAFADRYKIIKLLGDGGMGKVYLAEDLVLEGEKVALKVLRPDLCQDEKHIKRFIREVQLTRKVAHPNVVRTFDIAWHEGALYFTMEYVEGLTLKDKLQQGTLPARNAMQLLLEISRGLSVIHECEIIHRDLKPGNIIISSTGVAKIADFGIARPSFTDITNQNEVIGSAGYMAPEVWTGAPLDARTDVYALGVLCYEMVTGILPFDGSSATEVMNRHLSYQPPRLESVGAEIPGWFSELINRMVAKDPDRRPTSAGEIISIVELGMKQREVAPQGRPHSILTDNISDTKNHKPLIDNKTNFDSSHSSKRYNKRDFRNQTSGHKRVTAVARQRKAPDRREGFGGGISLQSLSRAQSELSSGDLIKRGISTMIIGSIVLFMLVGVFLPLLNYKIILGLSSGIGITQAVEMLLIEIFLLGAIVSTPTWFLRWNEDTSTRLQSYLTAFAFSFGGLLFAAFFTFTQIFLQEDQVIKATNPDSILSIAKVLLIHVSEVLTLSKPQIQFIAQKSQTSVLYELVLASSLSTMLLSALSLTLFAAIISWTTTDDSEGFKERFTRVFFVFFATWGVSFVITPILIAIAGTSTLLAFEGTPWSLKSYQVLLTVIGWSGLFASILADQIEKISSRIR